MTDPSPDKSIDPRVLPWDDEFTWETPTIETLIERDPRAVFEFYDEADLERIAETNPELIDRLCCAYVQAELEVADAS